jgi:hypothetical protein
MYLSQSDGASYTKISRLGDGSFGDVYLVEQAETGAVFVSKEIKLANLDVSLLGSDGYTAVYRGQGLRGPSTPQHHLSEGILQDPFKEASFDSGAS